MKTIDARGGSEANPSLDRRWKWIVWAVAVCAAAWLALGVGILCEVGAGPMFALAAFAAVSTEGTVWLAALLFGVSAYQARRRLWRHLRSLAG